MKFSSDLSKFRNVEVYFDIKISMKVVDSRVPDLFEEKNLTIEQYNERIEFLTKHDHTLGIVMAKEAFYL